MFTRLLVVACAVVRNSCRPGCAKRMGGRMTVAHLAAHTPDRAYGSVCRCRLLNVVHVLLLARPSNGQPSYALRARFAPEESRAQALLVYAGLAGFLSRYLLGLVAAAAWLALLPLLSLAAALFLLAAMLAGQFASHGCCAGESLRNVLHGCWEDTSGGSDLKGGG